MNAAIGKLLTQFDANGNGRSKPADKPKVPEFVARPKEARHELQLQLPPQAQPQPQPAAPKAETPVSLIDDAYRRGHAAALAESDARLAEERVRGAIRLGEEKAKWSDQQAVAIVNGIGAACREIENNIATSVARILQPFLAEAVRDKAVAALVEQISEMTGQSPVSMFRISGPSELIDLVRAQLNAAGRTGIEYQTAETGEVRVIADQTVIETQLSTWLERLKEARR